MREELTIIDTGFNNMKIKLTLKERKVRSGMGDSWTEYYYTDASGSLYIASQDLLDFLPLEYKDFTIIMSGRIEWIKNNM